MVTPISLNGAGCATAVAAVRAQVTRKPTTVHLADSFMRDLLLVAPFLIRPA
jgi:hypothetical protein